MSTASILPQPEPHACAAQTPAQQLREALHIAADAGRIIRVQATPWNDDRISYRITVLKGGSTQIVHRLFVERATVAINDAIWAVCEAHRWPLRPVYSGCGWFAYAPDYPAHIRKEGTAVL